MRWLLVASVLLTGCPTKDSTNLRACRSACFPNGVQKYTPQDGCICREKRWTDDCKSTCFPNGVDKDTKESGCVCLKE